MKFFCLPALSNPFYSNSHNLSQFLLQFSSYTAIAIIPTKKPTWNSNNNLLITHPVLSIMETCNSMVELKQIHGHMIRTELIMHLFPASRVIAFCALSECADMNYASAVFTRIQEPNTYIWNTMIRGYSRAKQPEMGLFLFQRMVREEIEMDIRTFVFVLKVCERFKGIIEGKMVHCRICKLGFYSDLLVRNSLMHFYVKHGLLSCADNVFDEDLERDVVSWTTMIDGYAQKGFLDKSLKLFYLMTMKNIKPNEVTMIAVLSACSQMGIFKLGKSIHEYIEKKNVHLSINLTNALMDMYVKCGYVDDAKEIFEKMETKDVYSWTTMINGYAKCGNLNIARQLFDQMPVRNVVSWNAMISGYAQTNQPEEALNLFHKMKESKVRPVESTLVCTLSACAQAGDLNLGKWIHQFYVDKKRVELSVVLANALIDMYAKCGSIGDARKLFNQMNEKDLVSWNSMIVSYAVHGYAEYAINMFEKMKREKVTPDDITFVGILSSCTHGGLVNKGWQYFHEMSKIFQIQPKMEHYACMIDLLGRVGMLDEAHQLIQDMPMEPDEASWGALLNACKIYGNVELGKFVAEKLLKLNSNDSGVYALLSNMYATKGKWEEVKTVRVMMRENKVKKTPGSSMIEVDGKFHKFLVADKSHPLFQQVYAMLDELYLQLKLEGYIPNTSQFMYLRKFSYQSP